MSTPSSRRHRFLPALLLIAFLGTQAQASPTTPPASSASPAWFNWVPVNGGNVGRTTVVRVAAVGMILALFIMYRNKH